MAAQKVPSFLDNLLQGSVIAERAKFRVLDPKSGKRFNVTIKEKRPKWYQLCFHWWLRKLHIRKRSHDYCYTLNEPNLDPPHQEIFDDPDPQDSAENSIDGNLTLADQDQKGEIDVVVHITQDASGSEDHPYYDIPSPQIDKTHDSPQEDIHNAEEQIRDKPESDVFSRVRPCPQPRKEKIGEGTIVKNQIVADAPDDDADFYEKKVIDSYQQLSRCPESEIGEQNVLSRFITAD